MAKKHRRKKSIFRSRFYQIYFALVLLSIIGIILGARYLGGLLRDYESAQPKYVAAAAVRLFENADYETICDLDTSMEAISGGDRDFYVQSMRELTGGKAVSWAEAYSKSEDEKLYRVSLDGEKFAEFTLVPSGQHTAHGNRLWALGSITTYVTVAAPEPEPAEAEPAEEAPARIACTVTVPSGFTVAVDGATLSASDVIEGDIATASAGMLPEGVPSPTLVRYAFLSESGAPEIRVTDASGNPQDVAQDGEHAWSCPLPQDLTLKEQYEDAIVEVAKRIAKYSSKELKQGSVLKYCAKGSPAYASISNFDNTWGKTPDGSKFENIETSDYYLYSEDCFSCRVRFDYVARYNKDSKTYPTAYTLYFVRQGKSGKLYNFTLS